MIHEMDFKKMDRFSVSRDKKKRILGEKTKKKLTLDTVYSKNRGIEFGYNKRSGQG